MQIKVPKFIGKFIEKAIESASLKPGDVVRHPDALQVNGRTLLYFKADACVGCDQLDVFIGQLSKQNSTDLRVIDARKGQLPEDIYGGQLLLDQDGTLRRTYKVSMFPTLILLSESGRVEAVLIGQSDVNDVKRGLDFA